MITQPMRILPPNRIINITPKPSKLVFEGGIDFSAQGFRIPSVESLNNGSLVAFSQIQYESNSDFAHQDIAFSRSIDGGKTWKDKRILLRSINNNSRLLNPTTIYDVEKNTILLFITEVFNTSETFWWRTTDNAWDTYLLVSTDNGNTFTKTSIKDRLISQRKPGWTVCMPGLGTGVKMVDGTYVLGMEIGFNNSTTSRIQNGLMYSKDLVNWNLSNVTSELGDEANIVLLDDTTILLNARNYGTSEPMKRKVFTTTNLGDTWSAHPTHKKIDEFRATMGHTLKINYLGKDYIILSHMQGTSGVRTDIGISVLNNTKTKWIPVSVVYPTIQTYGYSALAWNENNPNSLILLYETMGDIVSDDISGLLPTIVSRANVL